MGESPQLFSFPRRYYLRPSEGWYDCLNRLWGAPFLVSSFLETTWIRHGKIFRWYKVINLHILKQPSSFLDFWVLLISNKPRICDSSTHPPKPSTVSGEHSADYLWVSVSLKSLSLVDKLMVMNHYCQLLQMFKLLATQNSLKMLSCRCEVLGHERIFVSLNNSTPGYCQSGGYFQLSRCLNIMNRARIMQYWGASLFNTRDCRVNQKSLNICSHLTSESHILQHEDSKTSHNRCSNAFSLWWLSICEEILSY